MRSEVVDVVVVGAGPAGAAAATVLARAGRTVALLDKAVFPRDKTCGDGLTTLALRELDALGFEPTAVLDWQVVDNAVLRGPSGREVVVSLPRGRGTYAAVAPRRQLDSALVDLAAKAGAVVREGSGFAALTTRDDRVEVTTEAGGVLLARYVIAADGAWSPVRKSLGLTPPGYLGEWHALREYATGVTGPAARDLFVWFDEDFLPGYAWSFPLPDGRANIGFGVLRDGRGQGAAMKAQWATLAERPHIRAALGPDATVPRRPDAWPIPARIDRASLADGRTLFVGDAAMATDLLTGEGIGQALLTGRWAAEAIIAAGALRPEDAAARYRETVADELLADHRMSTWLGRVLAHRRGADGALAVLAHVGPGQRTRFARWMFEDEPRAIALTPRRWHRRFLRRAGV